MATTNKLVLAFEGSNGKEVSFTYSYADPEVESATVKALVNGIIANGEIFDNPPVKAKSAKIVTTTESYFNLDA
ncbi:MAG: DUF2922 domain-containing protein [Synergistaceae bacterium]|nr:DUF2922 domain-containing protein [Synergistaceae bacterium]